jgi:hypothetical protein
MRSAGFSTRPEDVRAGGGGRRNSLTISLSRGILYCAALRAAESPAILPVSRRFSSWLLAVSYCPVFCFVEGVCLREAVLAEAVRIAPIAPGSSLMASASSRICCLYSLVNTRRVGRSLTSGSGLAASAVACTRCFLDPFRFPISKHLPALYSKLIQVGVSLDLGRGSTGTETDSRHLIL